jgi:predicted Zn-dependent peptidase
MDSIRKTAPEPLEPVPFDIPHAFRTTLPNGLRLVIFDDERLPLCSLRLAFLSGDASDPAGHIGLTSALTAMLTEGTTEHSSRELAEKIERLGANLSANSSDDYTVIAASTLSMYMSEVLELMAEITFASTFPENELDLYKRNTIENLKFQRSQPNFLAGEQTARLLYGGHPYGIASPKPADIEKLTRTQLEHARSNMFLPNNAVFIAVGDVRKDELLLEIEEYFGDWEPGDRHIHEYPDIPVRKSRTLTVVDRPGSAQANIVISNTAIPRDHPDYFPLLVMNQVLGAGASSRVFMNLREEKGYTYGAYTRLDAKRFAGHFEATAEVRTAVTGDSLKEFFYELERIRSERVLDGELDDAKNFLTGVFPIRAETQEGLTNLIVNQELYGLPHDFLQTYRDHVDAVTADEVLKVANDHVLPDAAAIVIVGDAFEILSQARGYAPEFEILDREGNPRDAASYEKAAGGEPANVGGTWAVELDFQGQPVPVTMTLVQDGAAVTGSLSTMLGEGQIADGLVEGPRFSATAVTEIQGQAVELIINANADGDTLKGTISSAMIPDALEFAGNREV